ncbi:hypothetical protein HAX54_045473, partial [Datura stramonium]|nr:hypothetical protein [Datura stramonium]
VIGHDFQQRLSLNSENKEQDGRTCALGIAHAKKHKAWREEQAQVQHSLTRHTGDIAAVAGTTCGKFSASSSATRIKVGASSGVLRNKSGGFSAATGGTVQVEKF